MMAISINGTSVEKLLLGVWREACRHIDIDQSAERIAHLLANHIPADLLIVRRIDAGRHLLETVASGACRSGVALPTSTRGRSAPDSSWATS